MVQHESNLEIVFVGWVDAIRRRDIETVAGHLAPDVVWQGVTPDLVCPDRDAVLEVLRGPAPDPSAVEAFELIAADDHVVVGVRHPELPELDGVDIGGQIFNVFRLRDGRIVHIQDYARREDALVAAGAEERGHWQ